MPCMREESYVKSLGEVEKAKAVCRDRLKDRLWRELWRDMIEVDGMEERVEEIGEGFYKVTVEI